jgi:hypothetical protein
VWSTVFLLFLIAMVVEAGREAYFPDLRDWASRHYSRMQIVKELPWWAERRSAHEQRTHRKRFHIDLLGRPRVKKHHRRV